jgi:deazaflavin-dependent oxidoreductase (nitroreductase family)
MERIDVDATVRELESGTLPGWIADHLRRYRESGGREGHLFDATAVGGRADTPSLLLTTTGRHSGERRPMPLFYGTDGPRYVVIGSKGGADTHPAWYLNLCAEPRVELQVGPESFAAIARVAGGAERERLWRLMAGIYPPYDAYQAKTTREIPVVVLERER